MNSPRGRDPISVLKILQVLYKGVEYMIKFYPRHWITAKPRVHIPKSLFCAYYDFALKIGTI